MVASRDLRAGDIVLKERVCVHTPNLENSPPVCVVCYRLLSPASFRPCRRCLVPTCGEECAAADAHKVGRLSFVTDNVTDITITLTGLSIFKVFHWFHYHLNLVYVYNTNLKL